MRERCAQLVQLGFLAAGLAACAQNSGSPGPAATPQTLAESRIDLRELVGRTVSNADRAATVQGLLDRRDRLVQAQSENVERYEAGLRALNADYDATREQFEQLISSYNEARDQFQSAFVTYTSDIKAATTKEEWNAIADYELKEVDPRTIAVVEEES